MADSVHTAGLAIGSGGARPGVHLITFDDQAAPVQSFIPMPAGVYALDLDPCRNLLACGTRSGTIHILRIHECAEGGQPTEVGRLLHGRPLLA